MNIDYKSSVIICKYELSVHDDDFAWFEFIRSEGWTKGSNYRLAQLFRVSDASKFKLIVFLFSSIITFLVSIHLKWFYNKWKLYQFAIKK